MQCPRCHAENAAGMRFCGQCRQGRLAEAIAFHHRAAEEEARETQGTPAAAVLRLGETYLLADRIDDARACAERALSLSLTVGERSIETQALRLLGEVAACGTSSDADQSERLLGDALAQSKELGLRPHAARCHLGLGALHARTGRPERSEGHIATALAMFREMEMPYWIEKAEAELRALA